jgi:hypothetical protein
MVLQQKYNKQHGNKAYSKYCTLSLKECAPANHSLDPT